MLLFPFHLGSIIKEQILLPVPGEKIPSKKCRIFFRRGLMFSKFPKLLFLKRGGKSNKCITPLDIILSHNYYPLCWWWSVLNIFWWLFVTAFQCTYMDCIMWCSCPLSLNVSESRFWKTTWSENIWMTFQAIVLQMWWFHPTLMKGWVISVFCLTGLTYCQNCRNSPPL